ncbi:iron sulfur assembly protein 1 [Cordyceps fumosorosea ARSEF 2679]|uniref:Iron-sulfur assembly protein 1 n=1 Tax=Cordyceps fumosorosea (strain ARSEF 2679) TaxID=1081104 RepID=A0A168ARX7_CORFA|nr:iron sulfur assembly protein 1 [Cordyceps fumosorosea ARSEF 2679]OAA69115.1 iron sulfur assembly protein 1 [Cordyceps fumosorosea ARSEF 2679]
MNAHLFIGRVAAARHAASRLALRQFSTSRPACAAYHPYSLPSQSSGKTRGDELSETSIAFPEEALPRVHETRPPPSSPASPAPAPSPQPPAQATSPAPSSSTTMSTPQPKPAAAAAAETQPQKAKPTRPRSKLRPRKAAMKLTPAAVEQLRNLLDQPEPKLIKVGVRNRGCSGLAYHLEFVDKPGAFDETVEQDGVRVLIDSKALFSIIGSEMDWAEDKLSQRFVFRNPNIKEECGCGESFMV